MKLSARSRYAARILLELARQKGVSPLSAATLSQRTGVSIQFVEQILKPLKQRGFTASTRGAAGGHTLACPATDISLGEVVRLMEGGIQLSVCCGEKANYCPRQEKCLTREAWQRISRHLEQELDSILLSALLTDSSHCRGGYKETPSPISASRVFSGDARIKNPLPRQMKKKPPARPGRPPRITVIRRSKGTPSA